MSRLLRRVNQAACSRSFSSGEKIRPTKKVIHSSDAGADDFVTTCLLARDASVQLKAICITNADCVPQYALSAYSKLVQLLQRDDEKATSKPIPYGLSEARCFNAFPWSWRSDTIRIDETKSLNRTTPHVSTPWLEFTGDKLLISSLESASPDNQVYIVAAGPLTTLANVFRMKPNLMENVAALYWMGGALDVTGNVDASNKDTVFLHPKASSKSAEWNVFADAFAADWMLKHVKAFDIHLVPLDVCNQAKLTRDFLDALSASQSRYANFVFDCYRAVSDLELYHMWDVVAAATLTRPDLFEIPTPESVTVRTGANDHGAMVRDDNGRNVLVYTRFKNDNADAFRHYVLQTLEEYPRKCKDSTLGQPD